jgi:CBS-domain-containing membrane protein
MYCELFKVHFWSCRLQSNFKILFNQPFHLPPVHIKSHTMSVSQVSFTRSDYRGATVEDLDIKPAISINPNTHLQEALEISYENEFTYLPVIHEENRKLLGVLNVEDLKKNLEKYKKSGVKPEVKNFMLWFNQTARERYEKTSSSKPTATKTPINSTIMKPESSSDKRYQVLTPLTSLEDLAIFFNSGEYFAIITNPEGNFVYGVATPEDLKNYEKSRPKL